MENINTQLLFILIVLAVGFTRIIKTLITIADELKEMRKHLTEINNELLKEESI